MTPTPIERVYLNYRERWEAHYLSACRRRNTRAMCEAQDHINRAAMMLLKCKGEAQ